MGTRHVVSVVVSIAVAAAGVALAETGAMTGKCVKVVDGDTLIIKCDKDRRITIDLEGVDAPELGQPLGGDVRRFVQQMVRGQQLEFEVVTTDGESSTGRVRVAGRDLSHMLAAHGFAWATGEGVDAAELAELSRKAKETPCGIWKSGEPEPPWDYRADRA